MTLKPFYSYCMCIVAHLFSLQCTFMIMCHHLESHLNFFLIIFCLCFPSWITSPSLPRVFQAFFYSLLSFTSSHFLSQGPFFFLHLFSIVLCIPLLLIHFPHFCTWFLCEGGICIWCYQAQIILDVIITLELLLLYMFCKLTLLPSHPKIIVILHILHIDLVAFTFYNCALLGYFHLFMHCAFLHCFLFCILFLLLSLLFLL
jgi:hypothetical protein